MKALTIWRPWARYVATGDKRIENRSWTPPEAMLGETIAIHAGKKWDDNGAEMCSDVLGSAYSSNSALHPEGVIGVARIVGWCDQSGTIIRREHHDINIPMAGNDLLWLFWLFGPVGWILRDARPLPAPIPCRGMQGLWRLPADVEALLLAQPRAVTP